MSQKREVNREKHQMAAVSGPISSYHLKQAHMFCNTRSVINVPFYLIIRVIPLWSCPGRARLCAECDVICVFTVFIFHTFHTSSSELDCEHYSYLQKNTLLRHLPSSLLWLSVSSWKSLTFLDFFFFMGSIKSSSSCVSDGSVSIVSSFWKFAIYLV